MGITKGITVTLDGTKQAATALNIYGIAFDLIGHADNEGKFNFGDEASTAVGQGAEIGANESYLIADSEKHGSDQIMNLKKLYLIGEVGDKVLIQITPPISEWNL